MRYSDRANQIHPIVAFDRFEAASRGRAVTLDGYAGVVDENVLMAEVGIDPVCRGLDGERIVEVNGNVADIKSLSREALRRFFTECLAPRAHQDRAL